MELLDNKLYLEDVAYISNLELPWEKLQDKTLLISGASGMIASCLIDVIMKKNESGLNCRIYGIGRNIDKANERFKKYCHSSFFKFISHDINDPIDFNINSVDYVIHMASNTHPKAYASDPIGTVTANIIGTNNLLDFAVKCGADRFAFASSVEVYGENRGDIEMFDEDYCGYINCNTLRAGYPESKRCGEALCQAYIKQKELDIVIPRIARSYGPTMQMTDSKAIAQFIKKSIAGENIILKSEGNQYYSYTYVSDAVSGFLYVLLLGQNGEAYNISNQKSDITLKDLAKKAADIAGTEVIFELPDALEKSGYSTATKAVMDGKKIAELGWNPNYDISDGIMRTIQILKDLYA